MNATAGAVLALPSHLSDPRLAWPARLRTGMAGPLGFYVALSLLLAFTTAAGGALLLAIRGRSSASAGTSRSRCGARWAKGGDLKPLGRSWSRRRRRAGRPAEGRLGLGYRGRRLLRAEARHALVVFGPPQSGKSAAIAIPSLLEWQGPAVASSIKTDLYASTVRRREALGEVLVFDPYGLSPAAGSTWSPLRSAVTWDGALSTALRLTAAGELETEAVKGGNYWAAAAEQRLAPLLWAAANTGGGMGAVVRWAYGQGDVELPGILGHLLQQAHGARQVADSQAAFDAHVAFEALAGETRSSIESTVQMLLRAYRSPRVQASAASCEIRPDQFLGGANTLYLIGDSHRSKLLRPIFLALLQELTDAAFHEATMRGGRLRLPLLLCLDELGNVAPLPNLAEVASSAPSHNIQLISIFHDVAQARTRYRDQAHTVINSHRAWMLLPGVADLETLRYFSDLLGEEQVTDRARNGESSQIRRQPLAAAEELRRLREHETVLVYGRLAPTKLRLRLYFRDRRLGALANPPVLPK